MSAPRKTAGEKKLAAWKRKSDAGPHKATLPSGMVVEFVIPSSNALIRADRLPEGLAEMAIMASAYPDGAEGYLADLGMSAMRNPDEAARLKDALKEGLELRDWLVAEMLVDPRVDASEVGELPEADVTMLTEFAERRRDTDHAGVKLPIHVVAKLAGFREKPDGDEAAADLASGADTAARSARGDDGE
jgi:hypothetical protein